MFDWIVEKHKTNKTWLMDVYIKFLAPVIIVIQLWMGQWIAVFGLLVVVAFMFPMRQIVRLQGRVSMRDGEKIALGFLGWLKKQPDPEADEEEQFMKWWKEYDQK